MKTFIVLTFVLFGLLTTSLAQPNSTWGKWSWLLGQWAGQGSGQPGQGDGTFSFKPGLDNKILIRESHSQYPATATKAKIIHEDLMIIYPDVTASPTKAIYFDNEGHTINYTITYADSSIILTSDKTQNVPVFRLSYSLLENDLVNTKFEMSGDGVKFTTYLEGKSKKTK
jgi:hypothetical protein